MKIDDYEWREIAFEDIVLPRAVMGISILVSISDLPDDTKDWLWSLRNCCGVEKTELSTKCAKHAEILLSQMKMRHDEICLLIQDRLSPHGFVVGETLANWHKALENIKRIGIESNNKYCLWRAATHPRDAYASADSILNILNAISNNEPSDNEPHLK